MEQSSAIKGKSAAGNNLDESQANYDKRKKRPQKDIYCMIP